MGKGKFKVAKKVSRIAIMGLLNLDGKSPNLDGKLPLISPHQSY